MTPSTRPRPSPSGSGTTSNIAGLRVDLVGTIDTALHPQTVGVWIRPSGHKGTP